MIPFLPLCFAFLEPLAAVGALGVVVLAAFLVWRARRSARRLEAVVGRRTRRLAEEWSPGRRRVRVALATAGFAGLVLAWMQPAFGPADGEGEGAETGLDLCVCLDVSRSMLARDLSPSRLGFAHQALARLAERTRGDRLALVLFAGEARLRVPLTRDVGSFALLAATADPVDVAMGGTDLAAAIEAGTRALEAGQVRGAQGQAALRGALLVVTDGEDPSGAGRAAAEAARARGLRVHCVGLGSPLGSKITVTGPDGRERFLTDRQGREVVSRMDAASLRAMAEAGGGAFVDGSSSVQPLVAAYEQGVLARLEEDGRVAGPEGEGAALANRYRLPLGLALVLLLLEFALSERRTGAWGG